MNYFVYILYSLKDHKLYVGCTSDLENRFEKHDKGHVVATRNRRPLKLIHSEEYNKKADAFNRERFFKSLCGAREKKKIVSEYLNKRNCL